MKNNKIPTQEMISAAKSILVAKAWEETVRIVVERYEKEILERNNFQYSEDFKDLNQGKLTLPMAKARGFSGYQL